MRIRRIILIILIEWHFFCLIDDYNHDLCSAYAHHQGFGRQEGPSVARSLSLVLIHGS